MKKEEAKTTNGALPSGTVLKERYRIEEVLGRGGFGIAYKAVDESLQVVVAIKEYVSEKIPKEDRGRKEAQIAATFYDLEGIVSIRDYFTENKTSYVVMDYVNGISIRNYIRQQGRMNGKDVLEHMRPVMKSMMKIHASGVIHRDISADNLMITREGRLLLIDFGAASLKREGKDVHTVIFKRGFAPIEQYRQEGKIGPWTDVYALCATIYFMITGMVPDDAMERWINDTCKPLDSIMGTGLSAAESAAIMKGLELDVRNRFQTVEELYKELYGGEKKEEKEIIFRTEKADERTHEGTATLREEIRSLFGPGRKNVSDKHDKTDKINKRDGLFILYKKIYLAITLIIILLMGGGMLWFMNYWKNIDSSAVTNISAARDKNGNTDDVSESVNINESGKKNELDSSTGPQNTDEPESTNMPENTKKPKITKKPKSTIKKAESTKKSVSTKKPESSQNTRKNSKPAATKKPADKKDNKKEYAGDLDQLLQ